MGALQAQWLLCASPVRSASEMSTLEGAAGGSAACWRASWVDRARSGRCCGATGQRQVFHRTSWPRGPGGAGGDRGPGAGQRRTLYLGHRPPPGRGLALDDLAWTVFPAAARPSMAAAAPDSTARDSLGGLPAPLSRFIGREREVEGVQRLLGETRLLTLVGPGGIGKTRLVLEVARVVRTTARDGLALVELATLVDTPLVPQAVSGALGIPEQPGRLVLDTCLLRWVPARWCWCSTLRTPYPCLCGVPRGGPWRVPGPADPGHLARIPRTGGRSSLARPFPDSAGRAGGPLSADRNARRNLEAVVPELRSRWQQWKASNPDQPRGP